LIDGLPMQRASKLGSHVIEYNSSAAIKHRLWLPCCLSYMLHRRYLYQLLPAWTVDASAYQAVAGTGFLNLEFAV